MPDSKVTDSYIGMDDPIKVYTLVHDGMRRLNFPEDKARSYGWYCQAVYKELKDNHDVLDSLRRIENANKLLPEAIRMNLVRSTVALKDYRLSGAAGLLGPVVDRLAALAKANGISLDECSLCVVKVALDCAGAGAGTVTSVSGIGIPLLFLSVVATFNDSYALAQVCLQ
jgi:hypothetical protein